MPTPRGLSQAPTSFIGSWCLDIHRLPLVACQISLQRCSRPLCSSQNTGGLTDSNSSRAISKMVVRCEPVPAIRPRQPFGRRSDVHEVLAFRPDPSGPNSAPRYLDRESPRSTPKQYWLRLSHSIPNGQCSTFQSTVAPRHLLEKRRMDTHPWTSAECSLERR